MAPNQKKKQSEEEFLRSLAKKKVIRRTALQIHFIVYIFVNILLTFINLINSNYFWSLWSIVGWGVGLVFHSFAYFNPKGNGMIWHAFSYCVVNALLIFIYFFTTPNIYPWYLWPLGLWGIGLCSHFIVYIIGKPRRGEDSSKSWINRKIDKEMKKLYPIQISEEKLKLCPKCGTEDHDGESFCARCGAEFI